MMMIHMGDFIKVTLVPNSETVYNRPDPSDEKRSYNKRQQTIEYACANVMTHDSIEDGADARNENVQYQTQRSIATASLGYYLVRATHLYIF